jgi:hypothetical protein
MGWLSLFLACQHPNSGKNLREWEFQSWFKVQAVPSDVFVYPLKCFGVTPRLLLLLDEQHCPKASLISFCRILYKPHTLPLDYLGKCPQAFPLCMVHRVVCFLDRCKWFLVKVFGFLYPYLEVHLAYLILIGTFHEQVLIKIVNFKLLLSQIKRKRKFHSCPCCNFT